MARVRNTYIKNVAHLSTFLWLVAKYGYTEGKQVQLCQSWHEVADRCNRCSDQCSLPVIKDINDYEMISNTMAANNIQATWLGLKRIWLDEFLWLDCSKPSDVFTRKWIHQQKNCAVLDTRNGEILAVNCSDEDKGVICQKTECSDGCSSIIRDSEQCIHLGNRCYIRRYNDFNWERGKAYCLRKGWDLAVMSGSYEQHIVHELSKKFKPSGMDGDQEMYWIGLRREEWLYIPAEPGRNYLSFWIRGEPSNKGNCSVMVRDSTGYGWKAESCSSKHHAICREDMGISKSTRGFIPSNRVARTSSNPILKTSTDANNLPIQTVLKESKVYLIKYGLWLVVSSTLTATLLAVILIRSLLKDKHGAQLTSC